MPSLRKSTKRHRGAIHSMNMVRPMRRPKVINPVNLKAKKIVPKMRTDLIEKMRNDLSLPDMKDATLIIFQPLFCIANIKKLIAVKPCIKKIVSVCTYNAISKNHSQLVMDFSDEIYVINDNFVRLENIIKANSKKSKCILHIHDIRFANIATKLVGIINRQRKNIKKVIYDLHDVVAIQYPTGEKCSTARSAETIMCSVADVLITPNVMTSKFVKNYFHKRTETIKLLVNYVNFPEIKKTNNSMVNVVYQGGIVSKTHGGGHRYYNEIFDRLLKNNTNVFLHIHPANEFYSFLKKKYGKHTRVRIHNRMNYDKLIPALTNYDIGFCGYNRVRGVGNEYIGDRALPNKIYEYIVAGLPAMVMRFNHMRKFVNNTKLGFIVADSMKLGFKKKDIERVRKLVIEKRKDYMMETQTHKLMQIYGW